MMEFSFFDALIFALGSMAGGIFLLVYGGNWMIDGAVYIAKKFGIPPLVVGFTIVAMGTSLPELVVSVFANLRGSGGLAIGNVIGSNIANILMVIGLTAGVISFKSAKASRELKRDLGMMLLCTVLLAGALLYGQIDKMLGFAMIALLLGYIGYQYRGAKQGGDQGEDLEIPEFAHHLMPYILLFAGLISITVGAEFLVRGAKLSATVVGVPEDVIALSVIAFGTSLPELSTCLIAARKGLFDIVFGNIIGSNVFNVLMILGITSAITPIAAGTFSAQLVQFDIWVALGVSVLFTVLMIIFGRINRVAGWLFFAGYIAYIVYIYALYLGA